MIYLAHYYSRLTEIWENYTINMGGYSTDKSHHDPDRRIALLCTPYFFLEASLLVLWAFRFLPVIGSILASNSAMALVASSEIFVKDTSYKVGPFPRHMFWCGI